MTMMTEEEASECMSWRWQEKFVVVGVGAQKRIVKKDTGYCGLAGKP